jgi:peptidyl-prolyl cis-trans isomerase B (cyclophilin B)
VSGDRPIPGRATGRRALAGLLLLSATLGLAACGSSSGTDSATNAAAAPATTATSGASSTADAAGTCTRVSAPTPRGPQHVARPTLRLDPSKHYVATLATNCGTIAIQLDVKHAPLTAASFAYLVRRGFYNDLTFHRVAANFVIQGGDPNGDGSGGPGYTIVEPPPKSLHYTLGTVAMAKTGADPSGASGSQFFIVTTPEAPLPAQYALVGKVVGSFAGVDAIAKLPTNPPQDGAPDQPVVISRATLSTH